MASWIWSEGFENDGTVIGRGWQWLGVPGTEDWSIHPERVGLPKPVEAFNPQELRDISYENIYARAQGTPEEKLAVVQRETLTYVEPVYWAQRTGKITESNPIFQQARTFHEERAARGFGDTFSDWAEGAAPILIPAAIGFGALAYAGVGAVAGTTEAAVTGATASGAGAGVVTATSAAGVATTTAGITATGTAVTAGAATSLSSVLGTIGQYGTTALALARKFGINIGGAPSSPQMAPRTSPQTNAWDGLLRALYPGETVGASLYGDEYTGGPVGGPSFNPLWIVALLFLLGFGFILMRR